MLLSLRLMEARARGLEQPGSRCVPASSLWVLCCLVWVPWLWLGFRTVGASQALTGLRGSAWDHCGQQGSPLPLKVPVHGGSGPWV